MVDALRQRRNFMLLYIIKKHNAAYRKLKVAHERTSINLILEMAATVRRRAATVCSCGARPRAAPSTHLAQAVADFPSAGRPRIGCAHWRWNLQVWKPARRQIWKSAVRKSRFVPTAAFESHRCVQGAGPVRALQRHASKGSWSVPSEQRCQRPKRPMN